MRTMMKAGSVLLAMLLATIPVYRAGAAPVYPYVPYGSVGYVSNVNCPGGTCVTGGYAGGYGGGAFGPVTNGNGMVYNGYGWYPPGPIARIGGAAVGAVTGAVVGVVSGTVNGAVQGFVAPGSLFGVGGYSGGYSGVCPLGGYGAGPVYGGSVYGAGYGAGPCVAPGCLPCEAPCATPCEAPCATPCDAPCAAYTPCRPQIPAVAPCPAPCFAPTQCFIPAPCVAPCTAPCAAPCDAPCGPCDAPCSGSYMSVGRAAAPAWNSGMAPAPTPAVKNGSAALPPMTDSVRVADPITTAPGGAGHNGIPPAGGGSKDPGVPLPPPSESLDPFGMSSASRTTDATFAVDVPEDAVVLVNGAPTKSTGVTRNFVSSGLEVGKVYPYAVQVLVPTRNADAAGINGTTVAHNGTHYVQVAKTVYVRAGEEVNLAFTPTATDPLVQLARK